MSIRTDTDAERLNGMVSLKIRPSIRTRVDAALATRKKRRSLGKLVDRLLERWLEDGAPGELL